jgi:alpha-galactosidase
MKVTIVGGGSNQWAPKLVTDLLAVPALGDMELVLEDIDGERVERIGAYARLANEALGTKAVVTTTTDQHRALEGADFVVVTISTGGFESMTVDLDVPARHGIVQSVGDTVGPGGISRALRNVPVLVDIARDMEKCCPEAWMLNITNPMTCLTRAVCRETSVKAVGLCHEVGHVCMDLAIALGKSHDLVRPVVAGVNHFPVVSSLEVDGSDGLRLLQGLVEDLGGLDAIRRDLEAGTPHEPFSTADFAARNVLKLALLERYGALPAAGDRHLAEFLPSVLTERSGWGRSWGIEPTPISRRVEHEAEYLSEVQDVLAGRSELPTWDSGELVAPVVDSLLTGTRRELPLNIPNGGQCADLPAEVVVESMCVVDDEGIRGRDVVTLPAPVAEVVRRHVAVQELTVEAALTGDRLLVRAAVALDPLAGRGDLADTDAMVDELLEGTSRWLPRFSA